MENKKVYIPSMTELKEMKKILKSYDNIKYVSAPKLGIDYYMYSYCLAKKIEYIVSCGGLEFFNENEKNDKDTVLGVLKYIPSDIWCTPFNEDEKITTQILLSEKTKNKEYGLDYLNLVSSKLFENKDFIRNILSRLRKILTENEDYRFTYTDSSFLNALFEKKLFTIYNKSNFDPFLLIEIEPSYILDINPARSSLILNCDQFEKYIRRMNVPVNKSDDIFNPKEEQTKKLIKFLMEHKEN